jgi:hypothetical protein
VDSPSWWGLPCLGFWFLNPSAYQVCLHCIDCHILYPIFTLHSVWGITFSIPRFSLGCHENFLQVHSRDDRESISLLLCLGISKPLSLRTGLILPYKLGLDVISFSLSMSLLFFFFIVFNKKKRGEDAEFLFFEISFSDIVCVFAWYLSSLCINWVCL